MNVCLMRHAHAVERDEWNGTDAARPLIAKGRNAAAEAARGLARLPEPITRIITSPYLRALETADIVAARLRVPVTINDALKEPRTPLNHFIAALREADYEPNLLFVGHQPMLGQVLAQLQGDCAGEVDIKKAGVAYVALPGAPDHVNAADIPFGRLIDGASLLWLRTWRELAALAEGGDNQA
jgi:phosphohistidine phosphatase